MKKSDFIAVVAEKAGITKKLTREVCEAIEETLKEALKDEDEVLIFGTKFGVREVEERSGKIPARDGTQKTWVRPAEKVPYAKLLKSMKDKVTM